MEFIRIGEIVSAHGLKGGLKVYIYNTEDPIIYKLNKIYLGDEKTNKEMTIIRAKKVDKRLCILNLEELTCRNEAETYKKKYVLITREMLPAIPENYVYISLLIGYCVFDDNYKEIGLVEDFIHNGVHSIMIVRHINGVEFMIPFVNEFIKHIDTQKRQIIIHLMDGLVE